jgi:hypothetical protein
LVRARSSSVPVFWLTSKKNVTSRSQTWLSTSSRIAVVFSLDGKQSISAQPNTFVEKDIQKCEALWSSGSN